MTRRLRLPGALVAAAAALAAAAPAQAGLIAPETVDGPSADIAGLAGVKLARDGTGSVAYLKRDADGTHIYAAPLELGSPRAPQRVDAGQTGTATDVRLAVTNEFGALVTWVNDGKLYGSQRPSMNAPWSAPQLIFADPGGQPVRDPSMDITLFGTGYVSFTLGGDVRVARLSPSDGTWTLLPAPMDIDPGRPAGDSEVAASADGTAIVAWTETYGDGVNHVWVRRIQRNGDPSGVPREVGLPALDGHPGGSADSPTVEIQDDSTYAFVAARQDFADGAGTASRVIARRLTTSNMEDATAIDGLGFPAGGAAGAPELDLMGRGRGISATPMRSGDIVADSVTRSGLLGIKWLAPTPIATGAAAPPPMSTTIGEGARGFITWQPDGGAPLQTRYFDGDEFDPQVPLAPEFGVPAAQLGLDSSTDGRTDSVISFVQGPEGARRITVVAYSGQLRPAGIRTNLAWSRNRRPSLRWTGLTNVLWGPVTYRLELDGVPIATTTVPRYRPAKPLPDGAHALRIEQIDARGQESPGLDRFIRIDTRRPKVSLRRARGGYRVSATDGRPIKGSGIASLRVVFRRGSVSVPVPAIGLVVGARVRHKGKAVRVIAVDKARNKTSVSARSAMR